MYSSDAATVQQKQTLELFGLVSKELSQVWLMSANFVLHSDKNAFLGVTFCEKQGFGAPVPPPGTFSWCQMSLSVTVTTTSCF